MTTAIYASNVLPYLRPQSGRSNPEEKQVALDLHSGPNFQMLMESIWTNFSDAMRVTDSEGVIVAVNDAYCRFVGMQRGELVGKLFTVVYNQLTDRSRSLESYCKRFNERSVEPLMNRQVNLASGATVDVETSNSFIEGHDGEAYNLSIFHDITERKQMEQELERERGLLRTVIDNLPDRIFAKDSESRFIINNQAHIKGLGTHSQSDVVGKSDFDFRTRDVAERMFEDDQMVIRSGNAFLEKEERLVDRSGRPTCFSVTKVPMRDAHGNVIGLVGISRDITDRKEAEKALEESERKYHDLFNNAVQGIFQSTVDGKLISANSALLMMLGYDTLEELASLNLADLYVNPDLRNAHSAKLTEQGSCSNVELTLKRRDGTVMIVLEHSRAVKDSAGVVVAFEGILEDITERRALETRVQEHLAALKTSQETLAELNAQKDRLFSILSHDLRSPFTSILGFCEILQNEGEFLSDVERKEFLGHIENSAKKQLELLNKLLDWSRLETGRIKFEAKDVDLSAVVAISVTSHLGTAKKKDITLRSTLPPQMKTRGDEMMIMQVFSNLISNALKFTPAGGVISIDLNESSDDQWLLAVKDTGAGIPKDDFKKLFKIEEKYTRKGLAGEEGTGLGLSVVHEIVKKHSGSITVESEVGTGTTFLVRFPKMIENVVQSVLVVDDDEGIRALHSRYLKRQFPGSQILQACDGKEALELAKRCHPRIILTDYSMPEMNGFEFLNLLRQDETTKDIPVFVITGKDSTASKEAMTLSGAAAVLTKPVSRLELQEAIEKVMADKL
ncbi:MAG: PAS domain S-box protein [Ignavibacteriales bacterium]|nr:PAS domain S-box protein [Ignavibacteriales bacterium]